MDIFYVLTVSVVPVAMVSACGLITLALYNRLGTILARVRAFHLQKLALLEHLREKDLAEQQILLGMLDSQIVEVTVKARAIQKGLICLLGAIAAFLICSLLTGATVVHERIGIAALGMGALGLFLFLAGLGWAMRELTLSLMPLEEEGSYLAALTAYHLGKSSNNTRLKVADTA